MYTNSFHPHVHIILFFLLSLYSWRYEHYQIVSPQFFLYHNRLTQNTPSLHFFSHEQNPTWIPPLGETAPPQFGVNILPLIPFIRNTASDFVQILIPAILHYVSSRGQYLMTKGNIMCKKIWPWEVQLMGRLSSTQEWGIFSIWHFVPFFNKWNPYPSVLNQRLSTNHVNQDDTATSKALRNSGLNSSTPAPPNSQSISFTLWLYHHFAWPGLVSVSCLLSPVR